MEHLIQAFSNQDVLLDEDVNQYLIEDDVDQVFAALPQIMPPTSLVENIMAAVATLPLPELPFSTTPWSHLEPLNVSLETENLC